MHVAVSAFILFIANSAFAASQDDAGSVVDGPTRQTAYVEELGNVRIVTRYRDRADEPLLAPEVETSASNGTREEKPEAVWVKFRPDLIHGHADLEQTVRCLLIQTQDDKVAYGVYGLGKAKANLDMPLPFDDSSVVWDGVSAEDAFLRLLVGSGVSQERARRILTRRVDWFGPGLRAIFIQGSGADEKLQVTLTVYECLGD